MCVCRYGTNVLAAAALSDLSYIVGGCMDSCVHIWHFTASPEAAAAARMKAEEAQAAGGNEAAGGEADAPGSAELIEFSCGSYSAKVSGTVFNPANTMLATIGGTQSTIWDFTGAQGPAGSIPVVGLGHTKTVTCQVRAHLLDRGKTGVSICALKQLPEAQMASGQPACV